MGGADRAVAAGEVVAKVVPVGVAQMTAVDWARSAAHHRPVGGKALTAKESAAVWADGQGADVATVVADTCLLFALFGSDAHLAAARVWTRQTGQPITVTPVKRYELGNALRFAVFRKVIGPADALQSLAAFEADLKSEYLRLVRCDLEAVMAEAARWSERYTTGGGHRSFDGLYVATARVLKATVFLSFDLKQRKLAAADGLTMEP